MWFQLVRKNLGRRKSAFWRNVDVSGVVNRKFAKNIAKSLNLEEKTLKIALQVGQSVISDTGFY